MRGDDAIEERLQIALVHFRVDRKRHEARRGHHVRADDLELHAEDLRHARQAPHVAKAHRTVRFRNVWCLPGVPEVFRMKLQVVRAHMVSAPRFVSFAVYTKMDEGDLKPLLDRVVAAHPDVEVGSYPKWHDPTYKTKLTFDGRDEARVRAARDAFVALLPPGEPQKI